MALFTYQEQRDIAADLIRRQRVLRYMKARSREVLAVELGVHYNTIWNIVKGRGKIRKVNPQQVAYVMQCDEERERAKAYLEKHYTWKAISERKGVCKMTLVRYSQILLIDHGSMPLSKRGSRVAKHLI